MTIIVKPYSAIAQTHFNGSETFKEEYSFFIDILRQQQCPQSNTKYSPKRKYENGKRMKRGVMENIVSAYSDIFTKR